MTQEQQYLDLLSRLLVAGDKRMDRTGTGTFSLFGEKMEFDVQNGVFPVMTTKKVAWKTAVREMLWFLTGNTNIHFLLNQGVSIWTDWPLAKYRAETGHQISREEFEERVRDDYGFAERWGDLGPVYGKQWRRWLASDGREIDQVHALINGIRNDPNGRRHIFTGWNVGELKQMALPPCHMTYQFYCEGHSLSLMVHQRSCDVFLGLPFNIAQQAALLAMVAQQTDREPKRLVWIGGDTHLYRNHVEQVEEQVSRKPYPFPKMGLLRHPPSIDNYRIEDFLVADYQCHEHLAGAVSV
jgi:thymidylate synthase